MNGKQYFTALLLPFLFSYNAIMARPNDITLWKAARQLLVLSSYEYPELGVDLHNDLREEHSSPPLKLNKDLQVDAQAHANYLINTTNIFRYRAVEPESQNNSTLLNYSQNVHFTYNEIAAKKFTVALFLAMANWYEEESDYDYDFPKNASSFTRMMWKSSTEVGFGVATTGNETVVVANYWPAPPVVDVSSPEGMQIYKLNVHPPKDVVKANKNDLFWF